MSMWTRVLSILTPVGIMVGVLVALVVWSRHTDRFPLKKIDIKSELKQITEQEIQEVVIPQLTQGFFGLEVSDIQKSIKQLAWIESAEVRRVWPDQLVILVKEQTAQARWGESGILSTEGAVFYPQSMAVHENLPKFVGPVERAKEMQRQYLEILELLGPTGLMVKTLELSDSGTWKIRLDNGIAIILGKSGLNERTARFVQAYRGDLQAQQERIAYVDLRYINGFAIGWKMGVQ
jgi:cell division protein FtsQ